MRARQRTSPGAYARALEQALSECCGRPLLLSPRDWVLVSDWYERGMPLGLVLETLREVAAGRSTGLSSIAAAVEEAWKVVVAGRIAGRSGHADALMPLGAAKKDWHRVANKEPRDSPLRRLLEELLGRLEADADRESLDRELDQRLRSAVSPALLERARRTADTDLEPYKTRMPADAFDTTRERALADLLREEFGLPRLALCDPAR